MIIIQDTHAENSHYISAGKYQELRYTGNKLNDPHKNYIHDIHTKYCHNKIRWVVLHKYLIFKQTVSHCPSLVHPSSLTMLEFVFLYITSNTILPDCGIPQCLHQAPPGWGA